MQIISRSQWGARPPRSSPVAVSWPRGGKLWVHYSDGPPPANNVESEKATVRGIQAFHQGAARGWNDIGYAYLIAPSGRIYEGRGRGVLAAHCPGHNSEASVCLMWKSGDQLPPKAALDSIMALGAHLGLGTLAGHREGFATSCPGNAVMAWIKANRRITTTPAKPALNLDRDVYLVVSVDGRTWSGWRNAIGPARWAVRNGIKTRRYAVAWRGPGRKTTQLWSAKDVGQDHVTAVLRSILTRFDQ